MIADFNGAYPIGQPVTGPEAIARVNALFDRLNGDLNEVLGVGPAAVMAFTFAEQARAYALQQVGYTHNTSVVSGKYVASITTQGGSVTINA